LGDVTVLARTPSYQILQYQKTIRELTNKQAKIEANSILKSFLATPPPPPTPRSSGFSRTT